MPVEPKGNEDKNTFMGRCISTEVGKGHEQMQAVAICYQKWNNRNKKK
jgi:hypothetical protein